MDSLREAPALEKKNRMNMGLAKSLCRADSASLRLIYAELGSIAESFLCEQARPTLLTRRGNEK